MRATASFLICSVLLCVGCSHHADHATPQEEGVPINISSITGINQTQNFTEVKHVDLLPKAVLAQLGGIADPGQPFNKTDVVDSKLPSRQLVTAALSTQYCFVSYWSGGVAMYFETAVFHLSDRGAKVIWLSSGQGGLNFRDLKAMIESGHMHNDLDKAL